ncbi:hypothetical protein CVU75_01860 [Candidatus Dependentiae bacterium HGW-Dependentiae-1]|nr:MAG: hypothetical protein CVU75_01860 [Candidatus Dependentiae bacterium HGW-Dependentiae-1]
MMLQEHEKNDKKEPLLCEYYQARVQKEDVWFLVAVLRSFEHMAFDRTIDKEQSIFEFFVPPVLEETFLAIMQYFIKHSIVHDLQKLPNRMADSAAIL